jgi:carboxylesterase type B
MGTDPIVVTRSGVVQGGIADAVYTFKGIPYAAAPFGANRFRPPQRVVAWSGVRPALDVGAKPPAVPYPPPFDVLLPEIAPVGEDCLNLNIWSRALGNARLPVMVWIPGGQFEHGAGAVPAYDGSRFARDGVVCVTINYRAGADGFLYFGNGNGNANRGLLDQIAALEWVQENIAAFGGDPGNVTVFGQSAGAMSIASLLSMPAARGLFRRAILQSGAAHPVMSPAAAERVCGLLAAQLGVPATRDAIASVATDRLLEAQAVLRSELMTRPDPQYWGPEVMVSHMLWQPVVDGPTLPAPPIDRIASGAGAGVDVLVGTTREEWRLFFVPNGVIDVITSDMVGGLIAAYGLPADAALAHYRAGRPEATAGELLVALESDWYVGIPAVRLAEARAATAAASTWMYEFAWRSPQFNGRLGACHGLDIPFVFDTLVDGTETLWGPAPPQSLADAMHGEWVRFATTGRCSWPAYDLDRRATMRFDVTCEVVEDPRPAARALWEQFGGRHDAQGAAHLRDHLVAAVRRG